MAIQLKESHGSLSTSSGTILLSSPNTRIVFSMIFHNNHATEDANVRISLYDGNINPVRIINVDLKPDESLTFDTKLTLIANGSVTGQSDQPSAIGYWVSYAEIE